MSPIDVTIICLPLQVEKTCTCTVELCQPTCASVSIPGLPSLTAMHKPSHQFYILISESVTLSPRYFGAPLYWSLKFIKNKVLFKKCKTMYKNIWDNIWLKLKTKNRWHGMEHNQWVNTYIQNVTLYWDTTATVADRWLKIGLANYITQVRVIPSYK